LSLAISTRSCANSRRRTRGTSRSAAPAS
jgi:hypothetical protein